MSLIPFIIDLADELEEYNRYLANSRMELDDFDFGIYPNELEQQQLQQTTQQTQLSQQQQQRRQHSSSPRIQMQWLPRFTNKFRHHHHPYHICCAKAVDALCCNGNNSVSNCSNNAIANVTEKEATGITNGSSSTTTTTTNTTTNTTIANDKESTTTPHTPTKSSFSVVNKNGFQVSMNVKQFASNELTVKTIDNCIIVEGRHDEKEDGHGVISRHFIRKYMLPKGYEPNDVLSTLSSDGILTVRAPLPASMQKDEPLERTVSIQQTGPAQFVNNKETSTTSKTTTTTTTNLEKQQQQQQEEQKLDAQNQQQKKKSEVDLQQQETQVKTQNDTANEQNCNAKTNEVLGAQPTEIVATKLAVVANIENSVETMDVAIAAAATTTATATATANAAAKHDVTAAIAVDNMKDSSANISMSNGENGITTDLQVPIPLPIFTITAPPAAAAAAAINEGTISTDDVVAAVEKSTKKSDDDAAVATADTDVADGTTEVANNDVNMSEDEETAVQNLVAVAAAAVAQQSAQLPADFVAASDAAILLAKAQVENGGAAVEEIAN